MTEQSKQRTERERSKTTVRNWRTVPLSELRNACKSIDGAVLLLIKRIWEESISPIRANGESDNADLIGKGCV